MNPYSYPDGKTSFNLCLKQTTPKWTRYAVDFPTAHPTRYEENNTVRGWYYRPQHTSHAPLAILLHGIGERRLIPCRVLARALASRGIACFVPYLVFHRSRMPDAVKERFPTLTAEEWFEGYQVSVIDIRQVVDWAGEQADIDEKKVAVIGISIGGFISSIAMGVDERIRAGAFLISGGNSEKISWNTRKRFHRYTTVNYNPTEVEYRGLLRSYEEYLAEVEENGFENVAPARMSFLTDPMTFAYRLRNRPVLMINALWDEAIPKEATLDFWEACGRPPITWLPATHISIWLWYSVIRRQITRFLDSTFGVQ